MAEAKLNKKMNEVSKRWNQKITPEQVFGIYKNSEKYSFERQVSFLKQFFKPFVTDFDRHQAQFEVDVKKNKKTSYEAFIVFLYNINIIPPSEKPQIAPKSSISDSKASSNNDFDSPALCSTRVDTVYKPDLVSEVMIINI